MGADLRVYLSEDNINTSANTSRLRVRIVVSTNGSTYNEEGSLYGNFYGTVSGDFSGTWVSQNSSATVADRYFTIAHDSEGKRTVSVGAWCWVTSSTQCSASSTLTLTQIARASVIGDVDNFNFEDPFIVPVDKKSASFTDELKISFIRNIQGRDWEFIIAQRDNYNGEEITLTADELSKAYSYVDKTATITFTVTTRSGTDIIGTDVKTATGTVAGNIYSGQTHGVPCVKTDGSWKRAISNVKLSSVWRRGS